MNIFINLGSLTVDQNAKGQIPASYKDTRKLVQFPLLYFWLKDYYYQQYPINFDKTQWVYHDSDYFNVLNDPDMQKKLFENPPDIVAYSIYTWNENTLYKNASWIKEHFPNCIAIAGGPSAEASAEYFNEHPYFDMAVLGPGAEIFSRILNSYMDGDVFSSDGIAYLKNNKICKNSNVPRNEDPLVLDYINNFPNETKKTLDHLSCNSKEVSFPSLLMQGCPYSCSFCEQGLDYWTKMHKRPLQKLYDEIDFLHSYNNIILRYIDSNYGIHSDYEKLTDYLIEQNKKNKNTIYLETVTYAKQNVDRVFRIMEKIINSGLQTSYQGLISLQDINPDVLKINGRPFSKEIQKINVFKEKILEKYKDLPHRVELILGMPGQSYLTASESLAELQERGAIAPTPPHLYMVFPNTPLTDDPDLKITYKSQKCYVRSTAEVESLYLLPDNEYSGIEVDTAVSYRYLVESSTLSTYELASVNYVYNLWFFLSTLGDYFSSIEKYISRVYSLTLVDVVKKLTEYFEPDNHHLLPVSIQLDINAAYLWLSGKTTFFPRRDNDDVGYLGLGLSSNYRVVANHDDIENLFKMLFKELVGHDETLEKIIMWQGNKLLKIDNECLPSKTVVDYNYDEIAEGNKDVYYKSKFTFNFPYSNKNQAIDALIKGNNIQWRVSNIEFESIPDSEQVPRYNTLVTV